MNSTAEDWRKSSRSAFNGNCLEWRFRKSSHSYHEANCAEVALRGTVLVRDSKLGGTSPILEFSPTSWETFLRSIK